MDIYKNIYLQASVRAQLVSVEQNLKTLTMEEMEDYNLYKGDVSKVGRRYLDLQFYLLFTSSYISNKYHALDLIHIAVPRTHSLPPPPRPFCPSSWAAVPARAFTR